MRLAAFLRGINLGAHHRISKRELVEIFETMGFEEVTTFRASGNVVLTTDDDADLEGRIERGLRKALGYEVATFVRDAKELRKIAAASPFAPAAVRASKGKLQVALLKSRPPKTVTRGVLGMGTQDDRLAFGDRELYWLPSGGTQRSALDLRTVERRLGSWTVRTKGTIDEVATRYFGG